MSGRKAFPGAGRDDGEDGRAPGALCGGWGAMMHRTYGGFMEIRELQWFVALAESEHVTSAAERLNIAQPTLSRAIARLEKRVGVPLFDRQQNRLRLNKYGEVFRAHVVRAISEIDRAEQRIATLVDPDTGTIALGFLHSYGSWLVPELLAGYRRIAPATTFELRGSAADAVVDGVRHGRLDLGITSPRPAGDDLVWTPLQDEPLCLLVPAGHRLASAGGWERPTWRRRNSSRCSPSSDCVRWPTGCARKPGSPPGSSWSAPSSVRFGPWWRPGWVWPWCPAPATRPPRRAVPFPCR